MLREGDTIDIWTVEAPLGSGGMGSVYRCHNRSARRIKAAIKVLDATLHKTEGAQERFIREAEILFGLNHPNIVKVRNIRVDASPPYLEMEFVEGFSLEARLRRAAPPFPDALKWMQQLGAAVAYLHGRGVRHRDIKPANLLVDGEGVLKLVDFGLAVEAHGTRLTQSNMTFGTVSYAPPEWVRPETMDPELWDIYACGVVFWEMLTGQIAFPVSGQGSARQQAMQVIIAKQEHRPLDPGPDYHDDLRDLIMGMTRSDAAARTHNMAMVAARLGELSPELKRTAGRTIAPMPEGQDANTWVDLNPMRDSWAKALAATPLPVGPRGGEADTVLTFRGPRKLGLVLAGVVAGLAALALGTTLILWLPTGDSAQTPRQEVEQPPAQPAAAPEQPEVAHPPPELVPSEQVAPEPTAAVAVVRPPPEPPVPTVPEQPTPAEPAVAAPQPAVTASTFAAWLASHGDWQREAAISQGFADATYLEGWQGNTPPPGTEAQGVVGVSWYAAAAYCADRGGLAPLDAPPLTWTESDSQPAIEWRSSAGRPAWRDSTGNTSTRITLESSNAFTGFRCAR